MKKSLKNLKQKNSMFGAVNVVIGNTLKQTLTHILTLKIGTVVHRNIIN